MVYSIKKDLVKQFGGLFHRKTSLCPSTLLASYSFGHASVDIKWTDSCKLQPFMPLSSHFILQRLHESNERELGGSVGYKSSNVSIGTAWYSGLEITHKLLRVFDVFELSLDLYLKS